MKKVELMKMVLTDIGQDFSLEGLLDRDELSDITDDEQQVCCDLWAECREDGTIAFQKRIDEMEDE